MTADANQTGRREFLGKLGVAAAGVASAGVLMPGVAESESVSGSWDLAWVDALARAKYRVAFDANVIDDGIAIDHAATFLDQFHEVYGAPDSDLRAVLVMRQLGTTMGFNDSLWQRYPLGEHAASDPSARPAARRNPYWSPRPGTPAIYAARSLEALTKRGVLVLVCNVAATNVARGMAAATHADVDTVVADFRSNLVPGATLVPSGIFALIRAQNAGCAFMRAS